MDELCEYNVDVIFNPHLAPINRGILSTITLKLTKDCNADELNAIYHTFYDNEPFVRVRPMGEYAATKWVMGSNYCDISLHLVNERTLVVCAAIDNIVKGASGQAIQNMNLMFGLDERAGLKLKPSAF